MLVLWHACKTSKVLIMDMYTFSEQPQGSVLCAVVCVCQELSNFTLWYFRKVCSSVIGNHDPRRPYLTAFE